MLRWRRDSTRASRDSSATRRRASDPGLHHLLYHLHLIGGGHLVVNVGADAD